MLHINYTIAYVCAITYNYKIKSHEIMQIHIFFPHEIISKFPNCKITALLSNSSTNNKLLSLIVFLQKVKFFINKNEGHCSEIHYERDKVKIKGDG